MIPNFRMVRYLTLQVARVSSLDGIGARVFACSGLPWRRNVLPTVKSVRADRAIPQFLGKDMRSTTSLSQWDFATTIQVRRKLRSFSHAVVDFG
jgi:hypothetical protein